MWFIIMSLSITNIIVNSDLIPREKFPEVVKNGISCYMCTGFWVGFGLSFLFNMPWYYGSLASSLMCDFFGLFVERISK